MVWRYLGLIACLCLALALAACGSGSADDGKPTRPEVEAPDEPPRELVVEDLEEGTGPRAERGDKLTIHYEGVGMDGKTLYSSWRNGSPLEMTLGREGFGEGFEEGIEGMRVGGRRELQIPAKLAAFETPVIYVVDLLKVAPRQKQRGGGPPNGGGSTNGDPGSGSSSANKGGKLTRPKIDAPSGPPSTELVIEDLRKGSGAVAEKGDKLTVQYEGVGYDGKLLYSSWRNGSPLEFRLGYSPGLYGLGFEQGLEGMRVGGRRQLTIPPDLATSEIPLIYVVDLLKVDKSRARSGKGQ